MELELLDLLLLEGWTLSFDKDSYRLDRGLSSLMVPRDAAKDGVRSLLYEVLREGVYRWSR